MSDQRRSYHPCTPFGFFPLGWFAKKLVRLHYRYEALPYARVKGADDDHFRRAAHSALDGILDEVIGVTQRCSTCAGWQPIATAPTGQPVLIWSPSTHTVPIIGRHWEQDDSWTDDQNNAVCHPTHWMPLPTPPSEAN